MEGNFRVYILILILILVSYLSAGEGQKSLWAEERSEEWGVVETEFLTVFYPRAIDISRINRRINTRFIDMVSLDSLPSKKNPEKLLAYKFDLIVRKVQSLLDMYPRGLHINVKIYGTPEELPKIYTGILGKVDGVSSFYIHKEKTIYTTVKDISAEVLSHEIAHSIIDHYFVIFPSRKIQELLATYVEAHLKN